MSQQRKEGEEWRPRHVLILFTIGVTTAIVSATAYFSYRVVRGLIENNLHRNALLQVRQGAAKIDGWLAVRKAEVEAIAHVRAVQSLNWSVASPYLQREVARIRSLQMLALVKADGSYYSTNMDFEGQNYQAEPENLPREMGENTVVSDPIISQLTGLAEVNISTPIRSSILLNSPGSQLVGEVSLDHLWEVISEISFGKESYAFALNSQAEPIVHPHQNAMGTSFLQAKEDIQTIGMGAKQQSNMELMQLDGDWVYVAYGKLREANWSIVLIISRQDLDRELLPLNLLALVVGVLLAVAMSVAVHLLLSSEETRAIAEQEALLNGLTDRIRASLELDKILQTTVDEVGNLLNLEAVAFGWDEPGQKTWEIHCSYNQEMSGINSEEQTPILTAASTSEKNGYLTLPVKTQDERLGYLICSDSKRKLWSQPERKLLQAVADQLAIAINQSRLYSQTQQQVMLLDEAIRELGRTQAHLVQSEKMSSLGQMIAGIAHEINNPVNFIYGNITPATQYTQELLDLIQLYGQHYPEPVPEIQEQIESIELDYLIEDVQKIMTSMKMGAERIRDIVLSLRNFSRLDESDQKSVDIHQGIDNTLLLQQHNIKDRIEVVKQYGKLPKIACYPAKLNQVFMNLIGNAIDALREIETKRLTIKTSVVEKEKKKYARVAIADNGPGISEEIKSQIYDPFFTTKPVGKGTGLGLTISYQIITEVHNGKISCETPAEGGTIFVVEIPI
ncbi:MAG: ATP-binding protein [Hormoscilla sp.]